MKKSVYILLAVLCLFSLFLGACGQGSGSGSGSGGGGSSDEAPGETVYPLTITTYNYAKEPVEITFEKAPEKVLAVYQNSIETLLALGLEDRIIACAGLDHEVKDEYKQAFSKVNYLTEYAPSRESTIMLEPDFILSWYSIFDEKRLGDVSYWHERGIGTYMMKNSGAAALRVLENEYEDILAIGKIFNVQQKAHDLVNAIKAEVKKAVDHSAGASAKRRVLIVEFFGESITLYRSSSLGGDMVTKLGAELISNDSGQIGQEDMINLDPDVIFIVYMDRAGEDRSALSMSKVMDEPKFASLKAVQNKEVYTIQLGEMYCSGVRTLDGITKFAKGIYPELYN